MIVAAIVAAVWLILVVLAVALCRAAGRKRPDA